MLMKTGPTDYKIFKTVRETIYGRVSFAKCDKLGTDVAVKRSRLYLLEDPMSLENPRQEARFLRQLQEAGGHPNVLRYYDDFEDRDSGYHWMTTEKLTGGELFDIVAPLRGKGLGEELSKKYFSQMLDGLSFIHDQGIAHLDLSPENIGFGEDGKIRIIDFGLSRYISAATAPESKFPGGCNKPGKLGYMSPEIAAGSNFDGKESDIWSAGVVLFIMLTGYPPFETACGVDKRFHLIINGKLRSLLDSWKLSHLFSDDAKDLLQKMLSPANKRPSIKEIRAHPWMASGEESTKIPALDTQKILKTDSSDA